MKYLTRCIRLALLFCFILWAPSSLAHEHSAYSHHEFIDTSNPDWMSFVPGTRYLSELSIPGTHGSMARHGDLGDTNIPIAPDIVKNQTMSFSTQLESGIRAFDIRARHINNSFALHHNFFFQKAFFDEDILQPAADFLAKHPGEAIIMRVKEEYTPEGNDRSFDETFAYYKSLHPGLMWEPTSDNPLLDEIGVLRAIIASIKADPGKSANIMPVCFISWFLIIS